MYASLRAILVVLIAAAGIALSQSVPAPALALESGATCDATDDIGGDALWEIIKRERGIPPLQTPAPGS
jgi:hypothetical protein